MTADPDIQAVQTILSERGNGDRTPEDYDVADAALDRLAARLEEPPWTGSAECRVALEAAEAEVERLTRDEYHRDVLNGRLVRRAEAAEAERDEARAERDHWSKSALADRARTAEARVARLEEAASAYLDRHQQMKGAVIGEGDLMLLDQAEENLRAALASGSEGGEGA